MPQTANTKGKQSGFPSSNADAPTPSPGLRQLAGYVGDSWPGATTGGCWTASRLPSITRVGQWCWKKRRPGGEGGRGLRSRDPPGDTLGGQDWEGRHVVTALTTLPLAVLLPTTPPPPTTGDCAHTRCQGEAALLPGSSLGSRQPSLCLSQQLLAGMWARLGCTWVVLGCPTRRGQAALTRTAEGRGMGSLSWLTNPAVLDGHWHSKAKGTGTLPSAGTGLCSLCLLSSPPGGGGLHGSAGKRGDSSQGRARTHSPSASFRLALHRSQAHLGHPQHHSHPQNHWAPQLHGTLTKPPRHTCNPHGLGPRLHTDRDSPDPAARTHSLLRR